MANETASAVFGLALQTFLAVLKTLFGVIGSMLLQVQRTNVGFGSAVVLYQRNAAGADVRTGAALDAVKQVLPFELIVILTERKEMQLLWQQFGRARFCTQTAADTGLGGRRWG